MFVSVDFETRSQVDLRKTGVYPYAVDPSTDIWCMSYSLSDSDAVHTWCPGDSPDAADCTLMRFVEGGGTLRAWNSGFELQIWNEILAPRYGWPATKVEQWVDTAAEAAAMALPRGLGAAAKALGMEQEKDDKGYRLMMKMAKPRAVGAWWLYGPDGNRYGPFATQNEAHNYRKNNRWRPNACRLEQDDDTVVWWDDSESLSRLIEYCEQDVRAEKDIAKLLRDLSYAERQVFLLTQEMNDVGVPVDVELVNAAKHILEFALEEANREMRDLTDDRVLSVTKVNALREWVNENGLEIDNLRKDTVRDLLNGDLPEGKVRAALQLRQDAGKTSTAKLDAFLRCTGDDARARGLLMYHGASTGRWAGRLIQPQNFPRPEIKDVEELIPFVKAHDYEALLATGHPVPVIVSSLLRSMFCAPAGRTFMCADYSQVEARVLAWIAGQDDLVELFAEGGKVYETMGAFIFGLEVDEVGKDSFERQIGKNSILGCGFQMGPDRFAEQVREQTGIVLDRGDEEKGEPDVAAKAINGYRTRYPKIPAFWRAIEHAAISAVKEPKRVFAVGAPENKIKFQYVGKYLWCELPSGRMLCYAKPELREKTLPKPYEHVTKECLTFLGVDGMTRQWRRHSTYGGHLTENVVQAIARDLIAGGMYRLRLAGYTPILTVHDEVLVEVDEGSGNFDQFMRLTTKLPVWAGGLPLAGEGWQGDRYQK